MYIKNKLFIIEHIPFYWIILLKHLLGSMRSLCFRAFPSFFNYIIFFSKKQSNYVHLWPKQHILPCTVTLATTTLCFQVNSQFQWSYYPKPHKLLGQVMVQYENQLMTVYCSTFHFNTTTLRTPHFSIYGALIICKSPSVKVTLLKSASHYYYYYLGGGTTFGKRVCFGFFF